MGYTPPESAQGNTRVSRTINNMKNDYLLVAFNVPGPVLGIIHTVIISSLQVPIWDGYRWPYFTEKDARTHSGWIPWAANTWNLLCPTLESMLFPFHQLNLATNIEYLPFQAKLLLKWSCLPLKQDFLFLCSWCSTQWLACSLHAWGWWRLAVWGVGRCREEIGEPEISKARSVQLWWWRWW